MKNRWVLLLFAIIIMAQPKMAVRAGTVAPANEGETSKASSKSDDKAIQSELDKTGEVTLINGGIYYLSGPIYLSDNDYLDATGATIYCSGFIFMGPESRPGYASLKNVTLKGGKWRSTTKKGFEKSSFHFRHAKDITISDMDIKVSNYEGHTMEFVACKNVTVKNCKIMPLGKAKKDSVEEQIQIDIAAPSTAKDNKAATDGSTCNNIRIIGCTVKGCRAVCCNYAARDKGKYLNKFHTNITVKDCKLTGVTSEALAIFNTTSATVTGNKIISNAPSNRNNHAIGCHIAFFGKAPDKLKKRNLKITNNEIKGVNYGLMISSSTASQFDKLTLKNNKLYAGKGEGSALSLRAIKKIVKSKNKTAQWK